MNGKCKIKITLVLSLILGLALITGGCSSSGDGRLGQDDDRDTGGAERAANLPPADDRGTDLASTGPRGDDRRGGHSAEQENQGVLSRVDTPPEESLMDARKRTDHQSSMALVRENRDVRMDYRRPAETLARVDTSADAPNRGVQPDRAASKDLGGGGSQDKMGKSSGSANDSQNMKGKKARTLTAPPIPGEVVTVRKRWTKIRRAPRENSRSVALVYGNDRFQVVNREGEWVQVRFGRNNRHKGWLPLSALSR